ncbi:MAG TPA: maleylpyruvate isomerase N-terminal domain-containing protein [Iamia sp.]|nr:maleylpyruvate isomerase N-terminal domain-containing protein [Iamia sp.]
MTLVLGDEYRRARERLAALLATEPAERWDRPVRACPGWTVKGVVGHLVGTVEDAMAGLITGPPGAEITAEQVARHAPDAGPDLLARWGELAPPFEEVVTAGAIWPAVLDVVSHEHDIRLALGRPGARDDTVVGAAAAALVGELAAPWNLEATLAGGPTVRSPSVPGPTYRLRTSAFEVLRLRLGRRSPAEVRALAWDPIPPPDPSPLFIFGPRTTPLREI